jgi:hypothetical protein
MRPYKRSLSNPISLPSFIHFYATLKQLPDRERERERERERDLTQIRSLPIYIYIYIYTRREFFDPSSAQFLSAAIL